MTAWWVLLTFLAAAFLGWPVTAGILRLARTVDARETTHLGPDPAMDPAADQAVDQTAGRDPAAVEAEAAQVQAERQAKLSQRVLRGGLVIGLLERIAVVVAVLTDQPVAIAYIVAIKGLGRFPELKETPAASERFIIGTLASMLWAAGCAVLAKIFLLS